MGYGTHEAGKVDHVTELAEHDIAAGRKGVAIAVGLDGWHHTRAELDQFAVSPLACPEPMRAHGLSTDAVPCRIQPRRAGDE